MIIMVAMDGMTCKNKSDDDDGGTGDECKGCGGDQIML